MTASATGQALAAAEARPVGEVSRVVVADHRQGLPPRLVETMGRPGVTPPPRPAVRQRKAGPMVVGPGFPDADWVNTVFGWWLAGKPGWVDAGWYAAPIRAQVRALTTLDPGPDLLAALTALEWGTDGSCPADHSGETGPAGSGVGRPGLPCACLIVAAAAWEAVASWAAHRAAHGLLAAAGAQPLIIDGDPALGRPLLADPAREELAGALRVSPTSAGGRIDTARRVAALPAVTELVAAGYITQMTGKLMAAELENVRPEAARAITAVVADRLRQRAAAGLRAWGWRDLKDLIAQLKARLTPEETLEARRRARADRRVSLSDEPDGMATIIATVTDVEALRIYRRLTAIAGELGEAGDPRGVDQRRADAFVDLLLAAGDPGPDTTPAPGSDPDAAVKRPAGEVAVNVVITLEALLGLTGDPARIDGIGPVPAPVARELAADAKWRAWILDANRQLVIGTGSQQYRPTAALARLISARERRCRMTGCRRAAGGCDLDHTIEHPEGPTTWWNLGPLCRRHHVQKTHHDYQLHGPPDEATATDHGIGWTWTSPSGITTHDQPEPPLVT